MMNRMLGNGRVYRMARLLKEPLPHIIGHLEFLLKNAYEHLPKSGRLSRDDLLAIEEWALWDGKEGAFRKQLLASNLIFARKNGTFFAEFWKEAPKFVQNRWRRKELGANLFRELMPKWGISDAPVGHHRGPRAEQSRAEQSRADKRREEKSRAEQSGADKPRAEQSRADKPREEKSAKDVVVPRKTDRAPDLLAACSAQTAQLVRLLAEKPDVPPRILLAGAGMDGAVAINLCATNDAHRIRQVVVHAVRKSSRNPAGLIRKMLENPDWKVV